MYFYIDRKMILSDEATSFSDNLNNILNVSSFKFSNSTEILKANNIELLDNKKNKYYINKGFVKLKESILIGKDIKINLRNDTFGIKDNEPKLKGNSIIYENEKTIIKKVFSLHVLIIIIAHRGWSLLMKLFTIKKKRNSI